MSFKLPKELDSYEDGEVALQDLKELLEKDEDIGNSSVREFMELFGYSRRGGWIVTYIEQILSELGLCTVPDFREGHIDSEISLRLSKEAIDNGKRELGNLKTNDGIEYVGVSTTGSDIYDEELGRFLVSNVRSASLGVLGVSPNEPLRLAIHRMVSHDYSQLPVLSGKTLKGAISWKTIGRSIGHGKLDSECREFMEVVSPVPKSSSLFGVINEIVLHDFVFVSGHGSQIEGIVTTADLSDQFLALGEPFFLITQIEHKIRKFLDRYNAFQNEKICEICEIDHEKFNGFYSLDFGSYRRIIEHTEFWPSLPNNLPIDRKEFIKAIEEVRVIRNSVMHFSPDSMRSTDVQSLAKFQRALDFVLDQP